MDIQSLLRWGIENSDNPGAASELNIGTGGNSNRPAEQKHLDPGIIDMILGKPDSVLMKESLAIATDEEKSVDDRLDALDNFEMLIQQIDNANNMEKMGMWRPLQDLLTSSETNEDIKVAVLWIIGTAVQNNPAGQRAYLSLRDDPLAKILSFLSLKNSTQVRRKAVYALSSLIRLNAQAIGLIERYGGWEILKAALIDPDSNIRRKLVFLIYTLVQPATEPESVSGEGGVAISGGREHPNSHAGMVPEITNTADITVNALNKHGITSSILRDEFQEAVRVSGEDESDEARDQEFLKEIMRLFYTVITKRKSEMDEDQKAEVRAQFEKWRTNERNWDLTKEEIDEVRRALA